MGLRDQTLPEVRGPAAIALVLISVLSTADTEILVLASLIGREVGRDGVSGIEALEASKPAAWARGVVLIVGGTSTIAALYFSEVLSIYVGLISPPLAIAPAVVAGLFVNLDKAAVNIGIVLNLLVFGGLVMLGKLTAETAYYVVVPGFVLI